MRAVGYLRISSPSFRLVSGLKLFFKKFYNLKQKKKNIYQFLNVGDLVDIIFKRREKPSSENGIRKVMKKKCVVIIIK